MSPELRTKTGPLFTLFRAWLVIVIVVTTLGCASEVVRSGASFSPVAPTDRSRIEIMKQVRLEAGNGYDRVLTVGSIWELRGTLPQGAAYKRLDGIFTVEGAHVHEAYLVVSGNRLVGFYLPVEQAYSPARPVLLKLRDR